MFLIFESNPLFSLSIFKAAAIKCSTEKLKEAIAALKLEMIAPKTSKDSSSLPLRRVGLEAAQVQLSLPMTTYTASGIRALLVKSALSMNEVHALNSASYTDASHDALEPPPFTIKIHAVAFPRKNLDFDPQRLASVANFVAAIDTNIGSLSTAIEAAQVVCKQWVQIKPVWSKDGMSYISDAFSFSCRGLRSLR